MICEAWGLRQSDNSFKCSTDKMWTVRWNLVGISLVASTIWKITSNLRTSLVGIGVHKSSRGRISCFSILVVFPRPPWTLSQKWFCLVQCWLLWAQWKFDSCKEKNVYTSKLKVSCMFLYSLKTLSGRSFFNKYETSVNHLKIWDWKALCWNSRWLQ